MKLSKLAKLEKAELEKEKAELKNLIIKLNEIKENPVPELRKRLEKLVLKYGDERRTKLENIADVSKVDEEKIIEPEKCVVVLTKGGSIKRIPVTSFRAQNRNGKGIKTQEDITAETIRTNTVDSLMIFTNKGKMYRLSVNDIPVGTNVSKGTLIKSIITMEPNEEPQVIYSLYKSSKEKYVVFATKQGFIKRTPIKEYEETKKKTGLVATGLREGDELVKVFLSTDEDILLITAFGYVIRCKASDFAAQSKKSLGQKGINLKENDYVMAALPIRDEQDNLAVFTQNGLGKRIYLKDFPLQSRNGRGLKLTLRTGDSLIAASLVSEKDKVLVSGNKSALCLNADTIPLGARVSVISNPIIKDNKILSITKV